MDRDEIAKKVAEIVAQHLDITEAQVVEYARFADLGANEVDVAEVLVECGDEFELDIPEDAAHIETVEEMIDCLAQLVRGEDDDWE